MSTSLPAPGRHGVVANVIRGCLGNLVEWYDWFVYAAFSIYFATVFFPQGNLTAQLLSTAVVFAVGFLMRPLGGWLLGLYADRYGRRNALTLSVIMMGVGSLLIGAHPVLRDDRLAAPILLVAARLLQGLSVGGEFGSSATYLSEVATPGRRGFYSSFQYVSIVLGQLLALVVLIVLQQMLTEDQMYAWGWRVPFFIGAAAALVVLYLRRTMDESDALRGREGGREEGRGVRPEGRKGLSALLREYPVQLFVGVRPGHRRHRVVLHLHHLHAEVHGQHLRDQQVRRPRSSSSPPCSSSCACSRSPARCPTGSAAAR